MKNRRALKAAKKTAGTMVENGGHYFTSRRRDQKSFTRGCGSHSGYFMKPFVTHATLTAFTVGHLHVHPRRCRKVWGI